MKKFQNLKAVFFDAGGTLFRPYPSVGEIYARAASSYGLSCKSDVLEAEFHEAWKRRGGLSSLGAQTDEKKERNWWHSLVEEVFRSHGGVPRFDQFFSELHRSFEEKHLWAIYPEVIVVLKALRKKGFTLAVVSNWDLRLPRLMKNLDLDLYFDFLMSSSDCGATKPSPHIFKKALTRASAEPEETLHIGDTYEEDFVGAEGVGIQALLLDREGNGNSAPKGSRISSLSDILERI